MKTIIFTLLAVLTILGYDLSAQVNGYAQVTAVNVHNNVLTVSNVNQVYGNFEVGKKVIVYHTQGNVVSNLSNNSSYGQIGNIGNTGRIEIAVVKNIVYTSGIPTTIELLQSLSYTPEISSNSRIQVITYPEFINYSTINNISALPWDGNIGGVAAFRVIGNLTLNHNITADGAGFRGGVKSSNISDACNNTTYRSSDSKFSTKGEGIYRVSSNTHLYAMGSLANGGGGGNTHNAGGGGGSNFSAGGEGGLGWECTSSAGGVGGNSLGSLVNGDVVVAFLGGGGGGGQQNNGCASDGANGGGLIMIEADSIIVNSTNVRISANGQSAANTTGNDGAGAGGAGGSLIIKTKGVKVLQAKAASLLISANGGNGGSVIHPDSHGAGGGGGTGLLKYVDADLTMISGVSISIVHGTSGVDDNKITPRISAKNGGSSPGLIYYNGNISLPVELIEQKAECIDQGVLISWTTASEVNNDYFQIEKSEDLKVWNVVDVVKGNGNSNSVVNYQLIDPKVNSNTSYYRIKQVDYDGKFEYFQILSVSCEKNSGILEIVNTINSDNNLLVHVKTYNNETIYASLYDINGKLISKISKEQSGNDSITPITFGLNAVNGVYVVVVEQSAERVTKKIVFSNN